MQPPAAFSSAQSPAAAPACNGILVVDKPAGFTSFDVVAKLRGICKTRKIGHSGTLDPMATGVLPVFVGPCVKAVDLAPHADKTYHAKVLFGITTTTGDITGEVLESAPAAVTQPQLQAVLAQFVGAQQQLPPMYSAVKVNGKPLYRYAREGKDDVVRTPRTVHIHQLSLLNEAECAAAESWAAQATADMQLAEQQRAERIRAAALRRAAQKGTSTPETGESAKAETPAEDPVAKNIAAAFAAARAAQAAGLHAENAAEPTPSSPARPAASPEPLSTAASVQPAATLNAFWLQVHCSKGTYVRTLVEDIGRALGVPATLAALRRTTAGLFSLPQTHTLAAIQAAADKGSLQSLFLPSDVLFQNLPALQLNAAAARRLQNGAPAYGLRAAPGRYRVYANGVFLGLGHLAEDGLLHAEKLFLARE